MRILIAALFAVVPVLFAPHAAAGIFQPYCSGDQTPLDTNCKQPAYQVALDEFGLTPGQPPLIGG